MRYITCAPPEYDGHGTKHIAYFGFGPNGKGNWPREVDILPEHIDWQLMRYSTGMYAYTPSKEAYEHEDIREMVFNS